MCAPWPDQGVLQLRRKNILARDRTCNGKGLRDRNSPMCTLGQNGYGETLWPSNICPRLRGAPEKKKHIPQITKQVRYSLVG